MKSTKQNAGTTVSAKAIFPGIKKCALYASMMLLPSAALQAQQNYDNFDGAKTLHYSAKQTGLDTAAKNPASGQVNMSQVCAKYVRNPEKKFDNIKMTLDGKLGDVSPYATYTGIPPKIKMKVYTTAPVGTLVEILLGSKQGNNDYPAGTHSQYQAYTTKSGEWEELEFKFSQIPKGSETSATQVDQVTLLFNPNSSTADTYYFDDITGPSLSADKPTNVQVQNDKKTDKPVNTTTPINKTENKK